jgi:hypothetical protein
VSGKYLGIGGETAFSGLDGAGADAAASLQTFK